MSKKFFELDEDYEKIIKNTLKGKKINNYEDVLTYVDRKNNELETIELEKSYTRPFSYILPKNINTSHITNLFIKELVEYTKK